MKSSWLSHAGPICAASALASFSQTESEYGLIAIAAIACATRGSGCGQFGRGTLSSKAQSVKST